MSIKRAEQELFQGKTKAERLNLIAASPLTRQKRFRLSSLELNKERLVAVRRVFEELQTVVPGLITIGLYGSILKGYATATSDLDAKILIDADKVPEHFFQSTHPELRTIQIMNLIEPLFEKYDIPFRGVVVSIFSWHDAKPTPDYLKNTFALFPFFFLCLGTEVYSYRAQIITACEQAGKRGEYFWDHLMRYLAWFESSSLPPDIQKEREQLYPLKLADARAYFLREASPKVDPLPTSK